MRTLLRFFLVVLFTAACGRPPVDGAVEKKLSCRVTRDEPLNREVEVAVRATFSGREGVRAAATVRRCIAGASTYFSPQDFPPLVDVQCSGWTVRGSSCEQNGAAPGSGVFLFKFSTDSRGTLACDLGLLVNDGPETPWEIDGALGASCDLSAR